MWRAAAFLEGRDECPEAHLTPYKSRSSASRRKGEIAGHAKIFLLLGL